MRRGDRVTRFAGHEVHDARTLRLAVLVAKNPVQAVIERPGEDTPRDVTITLSGEPTRLGISWRIDEAEPGTVVLSRVAPGSYAELAGLLAGQRPHISRRRTRVRRRSRLPQAIERDARRAGTRSRNRRASADGRDSGDGRAPGSGSPGRRLTARPAIDVGGAVWLNLSHQANTARPCAQKNRERQPVGHRPRLAFSFSI